MAATTGARVAAAGGVLAVPVAFGALFIGGIAGALALALAVAATVVIVRETPTAARAAAVAAIVGGVLLALEAVAFVALCSVYCD